MCVLNLNFKFFKNILKVLLHSYLMWHEDVAHDQEVY